MAIENPWACDMSELRREAFSPAAPVEKPPELQQLDKAFIDFQASCPDFQRTPENVNTLTSYIAWNRMPTAEDFTQAHALATYQRRYAPSQLDSDPQTMPLDQLRRVANGFQQVPEAEPSLEQLREQMQTAEGVAE